MLTGGTEAFVIEATTADGRAAVLKILPPWVAAASGELQTLQAAQGRGYADVYAVDEAAGAILLERLGPSLATLERSVDQQMAIICTTLVEAWTIPLAGAYAISGAEKARSLSEFIHVTILAAHLVVGSVAAGSSRTHNSGLYSCWAKEWAQQK